MGRERVLDLAEEFFLRARHRLPAEWLATDLTMTQLKVLLTLYVDGPQSCGHLAGTLGLSLPTMTGILARLDRRGYLQRTRDERDGRKVISGLSPRGTELMSRLWAAGREGLDEVLAMLAPGDLEIVERAFEALVKAMGPPGGTQREALVGHGQS